MTHADFLFSPEDSSADEEIEDIEKILAMMLLFRAYITKLT
jgi:hypothetical protein